MVDVLRQVIIAHLPAGYTEKICWNVPYFRGNKGICIVWPATVPRGGIKEGVLLGFSHGNRLEDADGYLKRGTNKQVFYRIFQKAEEIEEEAIVKLLKEAVMVDERWKTARKRNR